MGYMNTLRQLILNDDPREFLRWAPVKMMMFPTKVSFFTNELRYLRHLPDWQTRWRKAIRESHTGHPLPFLLWPKSSGNLIRHAYHVARFEQETGWSVTQANVVLDFGGGYGSMCRLFHNLGFRGKYVIFDLPLFSYLQEYYLKSLGMELAPAPTGGPMHVTCTSDFDQLRTLFGSLNTGHRTMFIATESISEIPIKQRERILRLIMDFDAFLLSYSDIYREADNASYFREWAGQFEGRMRWYGSPIKQMPGFSYLFGTRTADHSVEANRPG